MYVVLTINPGSTSTKLAFFKGNEKISSHTAIHTSDELRQFPGVWDQYSYRKNLIMEWLTSQQIRPDAIAVIGGLFKPVPGGVYTINDRMLSDARANLQGEHISNIGCALAAEIAQTYGCTAYAVDPISVDEFEPVARISGHPRIERKSLSHALNIHAVVRRACEELSLPHDRSGFVVAHLGGGISVCPVLGGRIVDANDASSDGPFSPNRTGGLPLQQFISLCFSGELSDTDMRRLVMGEGGLLAYLGTTSLIEIEERIGEGDTRAAFILNAMAYQISKEIGGMATVLKGTVDAIILTGGLAASVQLTGRITGQVAFIAPLLVYPGEGELEALADAVLKVLRGEEPAREY
jgi:butyrate kinase